MICTAPYVIDGDTLACSNLPAHIRLLGIDAPELPGHCRAGRSCTPGDGYAAKAMLATLTARGSVECQPEGYDRYRRILARCTARRVDLSCAMVRSGQAVLRYSRIDCY